MATPLINQINSYLANYKKPSQSLVPQTHTIAPAITYTPNGQARAPGYYVPSNPWDTGYAGNRNYEMVGFSKNTDPNWNYDTGTLKPGVSATLGANGLYSFSNTGDLGGITGGGMGGGGGGGFSPNLGTYGYDVAQAKLAYDRAVAQSDEGISNLNRATGFMRSADGKTQIDPYNRFGGLQMLLGQQGGQLNDAYAAASDRGIGHKGLGSQAETQLRFLQSGQVADLGNQYQNAYKGFLQNKADALAAYELAKQYGMQQAIAGGDYYYGGDGGGDYSGDSGGDSLDYNGGTQDVFAPLANANPAALAAAIAKANKPKPAPRPKTISARKRVSRG